MFMKLKIILGTLAVGLVAGAIITESIPKVKKTVSGGIKRAKKLVEDDE